MICGAAVDDSTRAGLLSAVSTQGRAHGPRTTPHSDPHPGQSSEQGGPPLSSSDMSIR